MSILVDLDFEIVLLFALLFVSSATVVGNTQDDK